MGEPASRETRLEPVEQLKSSRKTKTQEMHMSASRPVQKCQIPVPTGPDYPDQASGFRR